MKKSISWDRVDGILRSFRMNLVGCELEYASTINYDYLDIPVLTSFGIANDRARTGVTNSYIGEEDNYDITNQLADTVFTHDGSINTNRRYRNRVETIFGPIDISEFNYYISSMDQSMKGIVTTNNSCGTHFHFNSSGLSYYELAKIQVAHAIFEPLLYLLARHSRSKNRFCKPVSSSFILEDLVNLRKTNDYRFLIFSTKKANDYLLGNKYGVVGYRNENVRYNGLNVFSHFYRGTVETRYFQNTSKEDNITYFLLTKLILVFSLVHTMKELVSFLNEIATSFDVSRESIFNCKAYIKKVLDLLDIDTKSIFGRDILALIKPNKRKVEDFLISFSYLLALNSSGKKRDTNIESLKDNTTMQGRLFYSLLTNCKIQKALTCSVLSRDILSSVSWGSRCNEFLEPNGDSRKLADSSFFSRDNLVTQTRKLSFLSELTNMFTNIVTGEELSEVKKTISPFREGLSSKKTVQQSVLKVRF